jgi:hypothetical protein
MPSEPPEYVPERDSVVTTPNRRIEVVPNVTVLPETVKVTSARA